MRRISVLTDKLEQTNLTANDSLKFQFRPLGPTDGMALHRLVGECPPLDPNSSYCNLLQCSHFGSTSMAVFRSGKLCGSTTGYRIPERPDTLFIWQVAVHPQVRGHGLARTMLRKLVAQPALRHIRFMETSITPGNEASWRLFTGFATELHAEMTRSVMFDRELHFQGAHESEYLVRIGPFDMVSLPAPGSKGEME
jgi:L-2,4-diaminobutyric acid acetyltransferase